MELEIVVISRDGTHKTPFDSRNALTERIIRDSSRYTVIRQSKKRKRNHLISTRTTAFASGEECVAIAVRSPASSPGDLFSFSVGTAPLLLYANYPRIIFAHLLQSMTLIQD